MSCDQQGRVVRVRGHFFDWCEARPGAQHLMGVAAALLRAGGEQKRSARVAACQSLCVGVFAVRQLPGDPHTATAGSIWR